MSLPHGLEDIVASLSSRLSQAERRLANLRRTGVVAEADFATGRYRVKLRDGAGAGFLSPWIPAREIAAGAIRAWAPLAIGEQVTISSESGDLTDAIIEGSLPSQTFPRPHDQGAELVIVIGETRLTLTGGEAKIESPAIRLESAGDVTVTAAGDVNLLPGGRINAGGMDGKPAHRVDDLDTAGDRATTGSSKLWIA